MKRRLGFTLIEAMICVAILAIVMASGVKNFSRSLNWLSNEARDERVLDMLAAAEDDLRQVPYPQLDEYARHGVVEEIGQRVPADASVVTLDNAPVLSVESVSRIDAEGHTQPLVALFSPPDKITLDARAAGAVVVVRYRGRLHLDATVTDVDDALHPTKHRQDATGKLITLTPYDGKQPIPEFIMSVLRTRP